MLNIKLIILTFTFVLFNCYVVISAQNENNSNYNLDTPDNKIILPDTLREISGLTNIDSSSFACIQDENGILFFYDATQNKLKRQFTFHIAGDYEGIARVNNMMYILRSDGTLFEISNYESKHFKLNSYNTGIHANNNEGLCYDPVNNRLLIGCKSKIGKGVEFKDKRVIYGFDLKAKTLSDEPVFNFDIQDINQYAYNNKIHLQYKTKKKGHKVISNIKFRISAICIHPVTKKLYLLSASDYLVFVFDMKGKINHIEALNPDVFNKAEGITFFENGDMLITNEGQDRKPTLLRFNYKK